PYFSHSCPPPSALHSFPTRRSSDLAPQTRRSWHSKCRLSRIFPCIRRVEAGRLLNSPRAIVTGSAPRATSSAAARRARSDVLSRSEEHTSELQSPCNLVCRLLLEKK